MDRRTDGWTDGQGETSIPPPSTSLRVDYKKLALVRIKYWLSYCVTCPSMSMDPGTLNLGNRRRRVPGWWDPGIRMNTEVGDTVLTKHT